MSKSVHAIGSIGPPLDFFRSSISVHWQWRIELDPAEPPTPLSGSLSRSEQGAVVVKIDVCAAAMLKQLDLPAAPLPDSATRLQPVTGFWHHHSNAVDAGLKPADSSHDVSPGFQYPARRDVVDPAMLVLAVD